MILSFSEVNAQDNVFTQPSNGTIVMQAEHFHSVREDADFFTWERSTDFAGYSGGSFMLAPDGSYGDPTVAKADAPAITYRINFTQTGTHYVYFRCSYADGNSDSYWLGVNDTTILRMNPYTEIGENFDTWGWSESTASGKALFAIGSTGEQDVIVYQRESGFRLDKIIITTDSASALVGTDDIGPAETEFTTGINDNDLSRSLNVYPNPVTDFANINFEVLKPGKVNISLFNVFGQKVKEMATEALAPGNQKVTWDLADNSRISAGVYYLRIDMAGESAVRKIVID